VTLPDLLHVIASSRSSVSDNASRHLSRDLGEPLNPCKMGSVHLRMKAFVGAFRILMPNSQEQLFRVIIKRLWLAPNSIMALPHIISPRTIVHHKVVEESWVTERANNSTRCLRFHLN
jgi:hypothetical protein